MQITKEDIKFLDENQYHYDLLINAQMVRHLDGATKQGMVDVIRKYWQPNYKPDLWCGECVMDMLKLTYRLYNDWKVNNKKND